LKTSIEEYETSFSKLMTEITAIKSGSMDKVLKDEVRGVLARKFGKKLLDSWVPDENSVKEALEAGPPSEEELNQVSDAPASATAPDAEEAVVEAGKEEEGKVLDAPAGEDELQEEDRQAEDITMEEPKAVSPTKATSPLPEAAEAVSSPAADKDKNEDSATSPASDLSPAPGSPVRSNKAARGNSKRKASTQPRGAPVSKRSTKRRNTATPGIVDEEPTTEEPKAEKEEEEEQEEAGEATELVPETPAPVEEELPKRGRRTTKRESVVRRTSTRKATSPETSTRHSSPINPKRALSASSARSHSATPAADGRSRRGRKGRGMRDGVVSKSVREQSTAEESAREEEEETPKAIKSEAEAESVAEKEAKADTEEEGDEQEEEEPEVPPTRSTRRNKGTAAPATPAKLDDDEADEEEGEKLPPRTSRRGKDTTTPVPDKSKDAAEKKSTRRSSARGGTFFLLLSDNQLTIQVVPVEDEEEEKPEIKEEAKGKAIRRPRQSSPRETKANKTMLNQLLDQISGHKNGSIFLNPVKPVCPPFVYVSRPDTQNDAPGYEDIIKRPMSIKAVRTRIREGLITSIDEFERDVMLIFAYVSLCVTSTWLIK
jgi:bromodomain-containing protein 8